MLFCSGCSLHIGLIHCLYYCTGLILIFDAGCDLSSEACGLRKIGVLK